MTDKLGAVEQDVDFNFEDAEALKKAFNDASDELDSQALPRTNYAKKAKEEFQGRFSEIFESNANIAATDSTEIITALKNATHLVEQLINQAHEENNRRKIARDYLKRHDDWWEKGWDWLVGEETPPVGPPSSPISHSADTPVSATRETSTSTSSSGGGVSSAIPENLRYFAYGVDGLNITVGTKHSNLSSAYSQFQSSCHYGSLDASGVISALDKWNNANTQDVTWAKNLADAFEEAGSSSGNPVSVADSALEAMLENAGVSVTREDLTVISPSAIGGQPSTGYTLDPVNTGNGNFIEPENDLAFSGGCASLALTRMYNSRGETGGVFGPRWSSLLDITLKFTDEGATWTMHDGRALSFARSGTGYLPCDEENFWLLPLAEAATVNVPEEVAETARWAITNNSGSGWFFSATGQWVGLSNGEGQGIYPIRTQDGSISSIHHERGRFITFEYLDGRIAVATSSDSRRIEYTYSPDGLLIGARGTNYARTYTHNQQGLIQVVANAAGVEEVVNTYDKYGRVTTQKTPHGRMVKFSYMPGRVTVVADENGERSNSWISDTKGRLVGIIDADNQRQSMAYDRFGNLVSATERDGLVTVHAYDKRGRRTRTVTPEGADITYGWDDLDRITGVVTASGGHISYVYDGAGRNPVQIHDALGGVTQLSWESGLLRGVVGPTGVSLSFAYTATGDLLSVTNALGETSSLVYDAAGRAVQAVTPSGSLTEFSYDDAGNLVSRRDPDGACHRFEYDDAGRCIAIVDPAGARTQMRYGVHGEVVETIDPLGRSVSRVFDDLGNVASAILPDGASWGFEHDNLSRLIAVVDPAGGRWNREYDVNGQLSATVDPLGNRVTATVDRSDQRLTLTDVFGSATTTTDVYGRPVKRENIDGSVELVTYDVAGNPVELVDGEGALTRYEYDLSGKLVAVVFPDQSRVEYGYDAAGRPEIFTDKAGSITRLVYDADSRVVEKIHPTGNKSTYIYDACGRLLVAREPGRGLARYGYDACGRLIFTQNGAFGTRRFAYDAAGQLIRAINGLGGRTHYKYDQRGRVISIIDPTGAVTTRTYTQLDKVDSVTDPLGRVTSATYDAAGRQVTQTDERGVVSEWEYDAEGRETSLTIDGKLVSRIDRDFAGRHVRIHDFSCGDEVLHELSYDRVGRLLSRSRDGRQMRWSYDVAGKLISRVDPNGDVRTYVYDEAARLARVSDGVGGTVVYQYDADSQVVSAATAKLVSTWAYTDGTVTGHRVADADGAVLHETSVSRDEFGRVVSVEKRSEGEDYQSVTYGYDDASQLTSTLSSTVGEAANRYEYDVAGRLVRSIAPDGVERRFTYDEASQLVEIVSDTGERQQFIYDGLGRRVRETSAGGESREFSYGATGYLAGISVSDADGALLVSHRIDTDATGEVTAIDGVGLFWDAAASVPSLASVGDVSLGVAPATSWRVARASSEADPFAVPGGNAGAFAGGFDALAGFALSADGVPVVAGIELMGARGYDPGTASFLSTDPLSPVVGAAWGSNPYSFAGNNPVNQVDPWGLRPATDADLQAYAQGHQGALAAAKVWWDSNWEYVAGGAMVIAGGILMATGVGGPVGLMLVSGGASMIMQKASTGSVDPVQLLLDMVPGGLVVQTVVGGVSGAYDYVKSAGPHTAGGFLLATGSEAAMAALPGPTGASKKLVGEAEEFASSAITRQARNSDTVLEGEVLPPGYSLPAGLEQKALPAGSSGNMKALPSGQQKLEDLSPTPDNGGAWVMQSDGTALMNTNIDRQRKLMDDSPYYTFEREADKGEGRVYSTADGNQVRLMYGGNNGYFGTDKPRYFDKDRLVFEKPGGNNKVNPVTGKQINRLSLKEARQNGFETVDDYLSFLGYSSQKDYQNDLSHFYFGSPETIEKTRAPYFDEMIKNGN